MRYAGVRKVAVAVLVCACLVGTASADPVSFAGDTPLFEEEARAAGIVHVYDGPWEFFVGGGGAAFDCDGDRKQDVFLAGGRNPAQLYRNVSPTGGRLAFEPVGDFGIASGDLEKVTGAYPLDIDQDGLQDLVLLRVGANLVLKGRGECRFEDATRAFGVDPGRDWTTAFSATFEAGSRFPTLAFGNYVDRAAPGSPWGTCSDNVLMRPGADRDEPDYSEPQRLAPGYCALSMLFTDWNRTGEPALRITNDRQYYRGGEEQLWRVEPGRPARPYRKADGWQHLSIWGMGIAAADLDGDGWPEYALTSMGDTKLQVLDREIEDVPTYRDEAYDRGATAHRPYEGDEGKPSTGWHAEFADFNNDTNFDLFIAKGNVEAMPDFARYDPDNLLMGDFEGAYTERGDAAGLALPTKGRGALVADFNLDGALDLLVVNRSGQASLFRNRGGIAEHGTRPLGNFLHVALKQSGGNRDAIGAKLAVRIGARTLMRTIDIGGGHASGTSGFVHLGLGVAERAQIRVQWPDGEWSHPYRVFANNFVLIDREEDAARYWYPAED
ncbi:FG-GAP repeat domain protein [Fulvimarina pelagi HTCC2506]|uniref:FG-GAP repeat domain protein n=2 Tax=Fulvimarina pelagi TaxID=217511 RepID=Q0FZW2_9HYPH|nr:CRTAC1 family protein [Fulvimarina pelagi]EAU40479.1 FG-GAP repeat domain protein [Fulvimarina pelagi HTCC2506]BAT31505.1 FG-GAP repeat domain protein [Fulvimarina pelagi]